MSRHSILLAGVVLIAGCTDSSPTSLPPAEPLTAPAPHRESGSAQNLVLPVSAATLPVVMRELHSPKGLAWGPDGSLYVVETGDNVVRGPCATIARGMNCYSGSGAISRLRHGRQERVRSGLPSAFNPVAGDVIGPNDLGFLGFGTAFLTIGWGGDPAARDGLGEHRAGFGYLVRLHSLQASGRGGAHSARKAWSPVADVARLEQELNPDGGFLDSNPFGLLVEPARRLVTDAGGNSLVTVAASGRMELLSAFPATPAPPPFGQSEAVPTAVVRGPDGALYVSTLSGVPFLDGAATIYRVAPGQPPVVHATGFKTITDIAVGRDGSLYVLEFASGPVFFTGPGRLLRLAPDGTRTVLVDGLTNPTSVLVAPNGSIYIAQRAGVPEVGLQAGEVLRFDP